MRFPHQPYDPATGNPECMESAAALKVRLVVDYGVGDNWLEAH